MTHLRVCLFAALLCAGVFQGQCAGPQLSLGDGTTSNTFAAGPTANLSVRSTTAFADNSVYGSASNTTWAEVN